MRTFLPMLGFSDLASDQIIALVVISVIIALALGWIADAILGDGIFGVLLNSVMLLGGAIIGMMVWHRLGYVVGSGTLATAAAVAAGSGLALLLVCAVVRRWV